MVFINTLSLGICIQLFRERLSDKTVRDNAERHHGWWRFMVFGWGFRCFSEIEGNSTNKCIYAFSFLVSQYREPRLINAKLFLPIIPIGIVAYAFTLLRDNLCRNSCIQVAYRNLAVHISLNPIGRSFQWQLRRLTWTNLFERSSNQPFFPAVFFPLNTRNTFDFSCYRLMKSCGFLHGWTSRRAKFCSLVSQFLGYFSSFL